MTADDGAARPATAPMTGADPWDLAQKVGEALMTRDHAAQRLGIVLEEIRPGQARMRMAVAHDMVNSHAICHGGLIFALADTAFAYACNARNRTSLAQSCTITYLASARAGDVLTAVCEEAASSGRSGVYDVRVVDQEGRLIALFRGQSRVVKGKILETGSAGRGVGEA